MVRRRLLAMRQLMPWYSQASPVRPSSAVGALHRRRDGLDPRRRCDSRHRSESLGCLKCSRRGWHSAPRRRLCRLAPLVPHRRRALLPRVGDSPCGCTHGAPPAASDAAADASGVAKHRRCDRQAPWALFIVVVMGSTLDDAATLVIAPSRSAV